MLVIEIFEYKHFVQQEFQAFMKWNCLFIISMRQHVINFFFLFCFLCEYLGYTYYNNAYFGQGLGPILLDDLLCTGSETRIIDCPRDTTTGVGDVDSCRGHLDDAGLKCLEGMCQIL